MVIAFAVVAAATYFLLLFSVERQEPEIAAVVPGEPPVVEQKQARKSDKAKEIAEA